VKAPVTAPVTAPTPAPAAAGEPALRVIVVDDEPTARQRIARLLREIPSVALVAECASGREALGAARERRPDVIFLDVAMPGLDGLAVARRLARDHPGDDGPLVVFVTAHDEHAVAAFRVHAADYVVKPLDRERLREAVEHARRAVRRRRAAADASPPAAGPRLAIRDGHRAHFVPIADVLWVESFGNYARVHTPSARFIHRATMARLAEQLAPHGFARVHRTAIVNAARVVRLRPAGSGQYEAFLDTGLRLRVSRTFRHHLLGGR
jgi:two-component system LytT family response regulator